MAARTSTGQHCRPVYACVCRLSLFDRTPSFPSPSNRYVLERPLVQSSARLVTTALTVAPCHQSAALSLVTTPSVHSQPVAALPAATRLNNNRPRPTAILVNKSPCSQNLRSTVGLNMSTLAVIRISGAKIKKF